MVTGGGDMKNLLVSMALYTCCFTFTGFIPGHVTANSKVWISLRKLKDQGGRLLDLQGITLPPTNQGV